MTRRCGHLPAAPRAPTSPLRQSQASHYRDAALPRGPAIPQRQWARQLLTGHDLLKAEGDTERFQPPLANFKPNGFEKDVEYKLHFKGH